MGKTSKAPSQRVRVRRNHNRAAYDLSAIAAILDANPLCHIAYVHDGTVYNTPTLQWREGERVYWHGSSASRMIKAALSGQVCLTVSSLDGLVLARSAFHHSVNYRSVMVLGRPDKVTDARAKRRHLETFFDQLLPGRWGELRAMTAKELKATAVVSMPLEEASAKVRDDWPVDDEEDYALPIWAGVMPLKLVAEAPRDDPRNLAGVRAPAHLRAITLGRR